MTTIKIISNRIVDDHILTFNFYSDFNYTKIGYVCSYLLMFVKMSSKATKMNTKNPIANIPTILVTVRIIVIVRL